MRRRLRRVMLPILIALALVGLLLAMLFRQWQQAYRTASNTELAEVLGMLQAELPEADFGPVVRRLQQPGVAGSQSAASRGEAILREYGYLEGDFASIASQRFGWLALAFGLICLVLLALLLAGYFWYDDHRRERQLLRLVAYLQDLKDHLRDLRLDENTEGELSLLTNELYKITVTLQEAAETNQRRSQNLETALADISHQLRTPLTSLQVMIDNIYDDPKMPEATRQDFLRSIGRQVESMSSLVTTLLNLAKFDNASIKLQRQPLIVNELFTRVRKKLEVLADLQDITLELGGDLTAEICLDPKWQTEALTNIVKNCIEHSPPGSQVTLTAQDCPLFLRITITDQGEGISPQDLRHIFERFYKAKNSSADSVGIGLAFAKTVIEAENGQISVKSQPGAGTEFIITYFK